MTRLAPAITIRRPWTTLILDHGKNVENRTWTTGYRGPLLIHAGHGFDRADTQHMAHRVVGLDLPDEFWRQSLHPTGLVAVADLTGVCSASMTTTRTRCGCGPWAVPGQHHWQLGDVRPLAEPVPARGALGLWTPDAATRAAIRIDTTTPAVGR